MAAALAYEIQFSSALDLKRLMSSRFFILIWL